MSTTILLTGAGGAAVPDLIQHLQQQGYRVLATDADPCAAGLYLADGGFVVPRGNAPEYLPVMRRLCAAQGVRAAVPLCDEELLLALELEQDGMAVIAPQAEFVRICLDKAAAMHALDFAHVPIPITTSVHNWLGWVDSDQYANPVVLKPRTGHGSKGVRVVHSTSDLLAQLGGERWQDNNWVVQQYIDGPEFTVSVVAWRDNVVRAVVPKEIVCKQGLTRIAITRHNEAIDAVCRRIVEALQPGGPFNVQLRMRDGIPYVFEINPRFSGTTNLTRAAGIDEVGGLLREALGEPMTWGDWQEGVTLVRRYADQVMPEAEFREKRVEVAE